MMKKMLRTVFWACLALLPSYFLKIHLGQDLSVPVLDFLLVFFVLLSLLKIKGLYRLREIKIQLKAPIQISAILVLTGFCFSYLKNFQANFWSDGAGIIKSFVFLPILAGSCFSLLLRKKVLSTKDLLWPVFISTSFLSVLGYFYGVKGAFTFDGRLNLFFESPNQLAMLLGAGLICGASLFFMQQNNPPLNSRKKTLTFLVLVSLFFHLFCLTLTDSLGVWIGLLAALFFVLLSKTSFGGFSKIIIPPLLLFLSLTVFLIPFAIQQTSHSPHTPPTSTDSRLAIYKSTEKIIRTNWVWGVGPGNFQQAYLEQQKFFPPYPQWAVPHAHSNLLHFWTEGGLIAFLGLFFLLLFAFKTKKQTLFSVFALSMLVYFSVHGLIDTTIWKNDLAAIFWISAFAIAHSNSQKANPF